MKSILRFLLICYFVTKAYSEKNVNHKYNSTEKNIPSHQEGIPGTKQKERGVQEAESSWSQDQKLDQMRQNRAKWFKDEPYEPNTLPGECSQKRDGDFCRICQRWEHSCYGTCRRGMCWPKQKPLDCTSKQDGDFCEICQQGGPSCYGTCRKGICRPKQTPTPPVNEEDCKCGLAKRRNGNRQIGGKETEVHEYPWMVLFWFIPGNHQHCGGSLINKEWILSAAHCWTVDEDFKYPENFAAYLGEHNFDHSIEFNREENEEEKKTLVHKPVGYIVNHPKFNHPEWNEKGPITTYDFALVKLADPVDFSVHPHIRPICLPTNTLNTYEGYTATTTGWGRTNKYGDYDILSQKLLENDVKVISNKQCRKMFAPLLARDDEHGKLAKIYYKIEESTLCAHTPGHDACQGDSGGPLVTAGPGNNGVVPGQNYELIGVVSASYKCDEYPGVYARVTDQLEWIKTTTNWDDADKCPRI